MLVVKSMYVGEQTWVKGFQAGIIRGPKEGIMGLTKDKKPIVLRNGDMVSLDILDKKFLELLIRRGMIMPIRIRDQIKVNKVEKLKYHRSKKGRAKKCMSLDRWLK